MHDYAHLSTMSLRADWTQESGRCSEGIFTNKDRTSQRRSLTGVHWFVVALIHQMEADLDFGAHLHKE
jgi:lysozyme family protein